MSVELSQLTVNRAVLELRFEHAVLLWDRTGSIFTEIRKLHAAIDFKNTQPNEQTTRLTPNLEFQMAVDRAFIVSARPSSDLSELKKACGDIFPIVIKGLEIVDLTRIGLRILSQKDFPNKADCAHFILERMPNLRRTGKHFGMEASVTDPEIALLAGRYDRMLGAAQCHREQDKG
jgi:hypothetical protein